MKEFEGEDIMKHPLGRSLSLLVLIALVSLGACMIAVPEDRGAEAVSEARASQSVDAPCVENSASRANCTPYQGKQCYWMENTSGSFCWVPASSVGVTSFQACYEADSCDGGLALSGGGCYKWADCSDCARYPWQ